MTLSRAEREVALMFCRGLTDKEIADRLFRSYHTVRTQKKNLRKVSYLPLSIKRLKLHYGGWLIYLVVKNMIITLQKILC